MSVPDHISTSKLTLVGDGGTAVPASLDTPPPTIVELVYPYVKLRKDFGRQPRFMEDRKRHHANCKPNRHLRKRYRRIRLLDRTVQPVKYLTESSMNTIRRLRVTIGTWHREGGWPKDVNPSEPESVMRQRKKMEKEEGFQLALPEMCKWMSKGVRENNSVEMYHELFPQRWSSKDKQKKIPRGVTMHILADWSKQQRPVHKIDWAPSGIGRIIVSHFPQEFTPNLRDKTGHCYIWEVANPSRPEAMVKSFTTITDIHFHPKDYHSVCASCYDGTVQFWDTRVQSNIIACSPSENSHKKPAMGSNWINSKTDTELMSVGMDGQVIWWDIRNLNDKLDQTWLDPEKGFAREEMALPATKLEFETALPTKFVAGTWNGRIMVLMKKGKTPQDRLLLNYKAHIGPIQAIKRNPMFIKNILTVGDGSFRVFAEDCRDSSIMWSKPRDQLYTHGGWIPSRPSVIACTRTDGRIDFWDILRDPARPYHVMRVGKMKLTHISAGPAPDCKFAAIGTESGDVLMQKLSNALCRFDKKDKPKLAAVFEREAHKEKNIEQRHRELRLRKRDREKKLALQAKLEQERQEFKKKVIEEAKAAGKKPERNAYPILKRGKKFDVRFEAKHAEQCLFERKFFRELDEELRKLGVNAWMEYDHLLDVKPAVEEEVVEEEDV